jgi:hypothetical protein
MSGGDIFEQKLDNSRGILFCQKRLETTQKMPGVRRFVVRLFLSGGSVVGIRDEPAVS